jgi:hypothetical protein
VSSVAARDGAPTAKSPIANSKANNRFMGLPPLAFLS